MTIKYRIKIHTWGILIFKAVPINELQAILQLGKNYECDIFDAVLSKHFRDSFCLISKKNSKSMRMKLGLD